MSYSSYVSRCLTEIALAPGTVALDAPCGYGRHTLLALEFGLSVVAVDISAERIAYVRSLTSAARRKTAAVAFRVGDLSKFESLNLPRFDLAIVTDYISLDYLKVLSKSLPPGGHLIFESFQARGGNWIDLPVSGAVAESITPLCELLRYVESPAPRSTGGQVTVKCFARRHV